MRKTKSEKFQLKSGPKMTMSSFKMMGSSPVLQNGDDGSTDDDIVMAGLLPEVKVEDKADEIEYLDIPKYDDQYERRDFTGTTYKTRFNKTTGKKQDVKVTYDQDKANELARKYAQRSDYNQMVNDQFPGWNTSKGIELFGAEQVNKIKSDMPYAGPRGVENAARQENFMDRLKYSDTKNKIRYEEGSKEYQLNKEMFERQYPDMNFDDE